MKGGAYEDAEKHTDSKVVRQEDGQAQGHAGTLPAPGVQSELSLFSEPPAVLSPARKLGEALVRLLEREAHWLTRAELADRGWTARECRLARRNSGGRIVIGHKGYKATRHATLAEIQKAADIFYGQATDMMESARDYWRVITRREKGIDHG